MYNEDILFELSQDQVLVCEENPFSKILYNQDGKIGSSLKKKDTPYFTFPMLEQFPFVRHGFSTRLGGTSKGMFQTMNLSYFRGDEKECVNENYRAICNSMGMKMEDIVFSDQVHDTKIHVATKEDCQGSDYGNRKLTGIDGLITNEKNVVLCTSYADCVPLFFVDKKHQAIGASHSGWKGTVGRIGAKTVRKMGEEFGTRPEDLFCVIGPSICVSCYEVSEDVIEKIKENFTEEVWGKCVFPKQDKKYQLDLWMLNKCILMEAGVPEEQISISNVCTCCNQKLLFSHRASGGKRGNLCGFLSLVQIISHYVF